MSSLKISVPILYHGGSLHITLGFVVILFLFLDSTHEVPYVLLFIVALDLVLKMVLAWLLVSLFMYCFFWLSLSFSL